MNPKKKKRKRAKSRQQIKYLQNLGAHIKALRIAKGYSTDRLYLEAGFSSANTTRIERGEVDAQICTLKRIADTLGIHPKELLDFD